MDAQGDKMRKKVMLESTIQSTLDRISDTLYLSN